MIREANTNDLDELINLYLDLHETSLPEPKEKLDEIWSDIINDKSRHLIVYENNGHIVSSCDCVIISNLTRNLRPYALIENVVTNKNYRGKGFALACLKEAREIAKRKNCYKMMLLTSSKNNIDFYEKAGYNCADKIGFIQWL